MTTTENEVVHSMPSTGIGFRSRIILSPDQPRSGSDEGVSMRQPIRYVSASSSAKDSVPWL